jgi:hypothetical protein
MEFGVGVWNDTPTHVQPPNQQLLNVVNTQASPGPVGHWRGAIVQYDIR